jgi:hypothetical protein
VVTMRGRDDALRQAEIAIQELGRSKRKITVPIDMRGLIAGRQWTTWRDMVTRCGGPDNSCLQALMIDM